MTTASNFNCSPCFSLRHIVTRDVLTLMRKQTLKRFHSSSLIAQESIMYARGVGAGRHVPLPWRLPAALCGPRREWRESAGIGVNVVGSY